MLLFELIEVRLRFFWASSRSNSFRKDLPLMPMRPMDFPQRDDNTCGTQRFRPRRDMMIIAINQRAIQIE